MVASTDIKFYVHTNTNAPQLQNAFGCMIDVLDACLVNGFGAQVVSALTVSGTTVTATFGSAHNFMKYQVIKIAGANQAEFNAEHRILTVPNANTITFNLATVPSATTATGTISCSLPPIGWLKPFSGMGKAAYRSSNTLLASRPYLRIVDALDPAYTSTYAKYAKVGIVEDMSSIDTILGVQAPYDSVNPDKNWIGTGSGTTALNGWAKWYYAKGAAATVSSSDSSAPQNGNRQWLLVGNRDYFFIIPSYITSNDVGAVFGFGEFKTLLNSDGSNTFLSSNFSYLAANAANAASNNAIGTSQTSSGTLLIQRGYNQTAQYISANTASLHVSSSANSGTQNFIGAFSLNNIAPFTPVFINETVLRGELPNIYYLHQQRPFSNLQLIENNGSVFIAKNMASSTAEGQIVLKIGDL